ncbi:MAG: hypothetical protein GX945_07875 [Lentisphaerae bacterium]|nr:hypothetical protein [Lentisphaerota bacterium]
MSNGSRILNLAAAVRDLINEARIIPVQAAIDVVPSVALEDLDQLIVCVTPFTFASTPETRQNFASDIVLSIIVASPAKAADFFTLMGYTDAIAELLEQANIPGARLRKIKYAPVYDTES